MCDLERDPSWPGPKLCEEAQRIVIEMVIAGRQNNEIKQRLIDEGHDGRLHITTLSEYRAKPEVKEAKAKALSEAKQIGALDLVNRLLMYNELFLGAYNRLQGKVESDDITLTVPPRLGDYMQSLPPLVTLGKEISRLVDTIDPKGESGIPDSGTTHEKASITAGQVLDALERLVEETEAARVGEEPAGMEGTE